MPALQVGLVQWHNVVAADNGAGPLMHIVNGKDHGGGLEMSWVVDDRTRDVEPGLMAGIQNALVVARTAQGMRGSAGQWPAPWRRIAGVISHSPVLADSKHSALMSIINVTFQVGVGLLVDLQGSKRCHCIVLCMCHIAAIRVS